MNKIIEEYKTATKDWNYWVHDSGVSKIYYILYEDSYYYVQFAVEDDRSLTFEQAGLMEKSNWPLYHNFGSCSACKGTNKLPDFVIPYLPPIEIAKHRMSNV